MQDVAVRPDCRLDDEPASSKLIRSGRYFHSFTIRREMLSELVYLARDCKTADKKDGAAANPGEHPDITLDGELAEINPDHRSVFWVTYCQLVQDGIAPMVSQIAQETETLIVRCSYINNSNLDRLVRKVQGHLRNAIVFDPLSDNDFRCVVTSSRTSTSLYFPCCKLVSTEIENIHMPALTLLLHDDNVDIEPFSATAPVPLYGSTAERFVLVKDDVAENEENDIELSDFSHFDHSQVEQELMLEKDLPIVDGEALFWLPLILSIDYWRTVSRRPGQVASIAKQSGIVYKYDVTKLVSHMPVEDKKPDLDFHIHFIKMWKPDRAVDSAYWKVIGQAMHTLENGLDRGLSGWISLLESAFKKAPKPNYLSGHNIRKLCAPVYKTFQVGEVDVRTLAWYAREDSPKKYKEWHDDWVGEALTGSLLKSDAVIGLAFYRYYWLEFMAHVTDQRVVFYKFAYHRLMREQAGIGLRLALSNGFTALYTYMKADVAAQKANLQTNPANCDLAIKQIDEVIDKLGRQRAKKDILGDLSERFNVPNITKFLDASRELTLVKNGVLCVNDKEIRFRAGKPQDYLVKSFGAAYDETYSWQHPKVKEVMDWSFITFIDKDIITFHWKFLASLLRGGNTDKKVLIWSGPTANNMKSTWQKYASIICGEKYTSMPMNFYTMGKGSANNATPAETRRENCRLTISEEPENKVPLMPSILKSVSGNDDQYARELYAEGRIISYQDKILIVCNYPPPVAHEAAIEERIINLEFGSKCVWNPPPTRDEQIEQRLFHRDPLFDRKLPGMIDAGLWIMVQMFPIYAREGISQQPRAIVETTKAYWDSINRYKIFIDENMTEDKSESADAFLTFNEFHRWYEHKYKRDEVPLKEIVVKELSARLGDPVDGAWEGWALRKKAAAPQREDRR